MRVRKCKWCGKEFTPGYYNQIYCSTICQEKVRLKHQREYYWKHLEDRRKYQREYKRKKKAHQEMRKARKCKLCGKEFLAKRYNQIYCSSECREEARLERESRRYQETRKPRKCEWCGREFLPKHGSCKYCSSECRKKAKNEHDRYWQNRHRPELKKCILEHDNCFSCPTPDGECLFD